MADLKIRDVDELTLKLLDEIVAKENYSSRNQLINEILRLYAAAHHPFFANALPPAVKYLSGEYLNKQRDELKKVVELTYDVNVKVLEELRKLTSELT